LQNEKRGRRIGGKKNMMFLEVGDSNIAINIQLK
jgi:hypothetical protein